MYSYYKEFTSYPSAPSALILAGVHGNEIGTISLAYDLIHTISSKDLQFKNLSRINIVPVVNQEGMRNQSRELLDGSNDLNRNWDQSTYTIRDELLNLINDYDIILDLHCSEYCDSMFLLDSRMQKLSSIIPVLDKCDIHYCIQTSHNATLKWYADSHNKIGLTWEQIGLNYLNEEVNAESLTTILNLLDNIHLMVESSDYAQEDEYPLAYSFQNKCEGLYLPIADVGAKFEKNYPLGEIRSMRLNKAIEYIRAKEDCIVITQFHPQYIKKNQSGLITVQPI